VSHPSASRPAEVGAVGSAAAAAGRAFRRYAIGLGLTWSVAFVVVALAFRLDLYGDGAIFSYAVAAEDSWAFHWRNIAARSFVHIFSHMPAEAYIAASGDAAGGVGLYALLFFAAPLLGLQLTSLADRSPDRILFTAACLSTALLSPLVFGCPTEMWFAHALFWPALALCHHARADVCGAASVVLVLAALVFTHEGALIFAATILATVALRGGHALVRTGVALALVVVMWASVKLLLPPDDYIAPVMAQASRRVIDIANFDRPVVVTIAAALALYALVCRAMRRLTHKEAIAAVLTAVSLAIYWLAFARPVEGEDRYVLRTVLLIATPVAGVVAATMAVTADGRLPRWSLPPESFTLRLAAAPVRGLAGAVALVTLVHVVETARFVTAWTHYRAAIRTLATGEASDPELGDARFVSSARLPHDLAGLAWNSTTPYLAVMLAPGLAPTRLVVDPTTNYFWLSCETAEANERADRAVPRASRSLVRIHACLHPHHW
jgi:hypothetical protein